MISDADHYEAYYADKLWKLIPAVYRAEDTDKFASNGPLREMVNRIGGQAAILRRGIDRLWEDQSIETCDEWVIAYIGDLLATNLVANLDGRGQRIDVAKTIYYRRRKGTPALLEQLAADITGWDAKVVEFFRRLGRTRHRLDPAIGVPLQRNDDIDQLQRAELLVGSVTRTPIGGTAYLRNAYGASKSTSAFDEFFHTADFRRGRGQVGWHNIPRLGVFLWRLKSYGVLPTTPVAVRDCDGWFTFDPTGRDIPLFAKSSRNATTYETAWVSPVEAQLPTPISRALYAANVSGSAAGEAVKLYPQSLSVLRSEDGLVSDAVELPSNSVVVSPSRGRFQYVDSLPLSPPQDVIWTTYHYGFASDIGAGPYDRRLGRRVPPRPAPESSISNGGANLTLLGVVPAQGTVTITDSLTYNGAIDVAVDGQLTLRAENRQRPLIRLPELSPGGTVDWTFTGTAGSCLVLDGLFISGGDVVLRGEFECVTLTCCTLDPGTQIAPSVVTSPPPGFFAISADGRELAPTRLWIEGKIGTVLIERCITGPIQTRAPRVSLTHGPIAPPGRAEVQTLRITESIVQAIHGSVPPASHDSPISPPASLADAAIVMTDGDVKLTRCTILGPATVHRLEASECILRDVFQVDDAQHGCVRFTAYADGSVLPRAYESVRIPPGASLFTATDFGQPGYAQLLAIVDAAIIPEADPPPPAVPPARNRISTGSQDGSEMGVFARERNPIRERGLLIKYQEYMPAGMIPVIVYAT